MRKSRIFTLTLIFVFAGLVALAAEENSRTWHTLSETFEAVWNTEADDGGDKISLERDGHHFLVSITDFSEEDQAYIREQRSAENSRGIAVVPAKRKFVLLVGVDKYDETTITNLECCTNDVNAIESELSRTQFAAGNIRKLTQDGSPSDDPSRLHIEEAIDEILKDAGPDDLIFMAFSGHGFHKDKVDYFCPRDASVSNIPGTAVSLTDLIKRLKDSKAKFKWLLVDACRDSGGSIKGAPDIRGIDFTQEEPEGILILQSCKPGQKSQEDRKKKLGFFTSFFIKGLQGDADANGDGLISAFEICNYTKDQTSKKSGKAQCPCMSGLDLVDFPICSVPDIVETEPVHKAGELKELTIKGITYKFRWCPPGEFMMGSPESEEGRHDNEKQHLVKLTRGFWLLETEVTQGMWESVMGTTISEQRDKTDKPWGLCGEGVNYPMYYVSWEDCVGFCEKLSRLSAQTIRLPSEAEWEYACRAGTSTPFSFGSSLNGNEANCNGMKPYEAERGKNAEKILPAKSYSANDWKLYDMHGNVWEWCSDWFDTDYYYTDELMTDPAGPVSGSERMRVARGGSWGNDAKYCRSAFRIGEDSTNRGCYIGFRVVLVENP